MIVAHRSTPGDARLFDELPELLAFLRTAVDISTIDVGAATEHGVLVAHADKSFVPSTAELALALMLDLARSVSESTIDYRRGGQPPQRSGFQLRGKTAGLIGFGAIARYLAEVLRAMGVEVLVTDPYVDPATDDTIGAAIDNGIVFTSFDDLLGRSHFVLPLALSTPDTEDIIDADAISKMRPGTLLVNVSRGELLDEAAVADALDAGQLGGLAMDVGREPDQRPSRDLASRPGVVATPHLGGLTPENADAQAHSSVEQVQAMLHGDIPPRSVNADEAHRLRAWWNR